MNKASLFTKARLKLTMYYILIFMTLSAVISSLFYFRTSQVLEAEYERMERRFQFEFSGLNPLQTPQMIIRRIQPEDLSIARRQIILQLARINGLILILVAAAGYILSGLTLAPIEASMEQQKRFISDIAHEIKTPLTALKTSLEVNLMDKSLTRPIKALLTENLDDVVHLDQLTTSMLKLSKNHDQPLDTAPVRVNDIINQAIRLVSPSAKVKKITINNLTKTSAVIHGDQAALTDLIKILLDNAIKYSPAGTQVSLQTTNHRAMVEIKITDQGPGIKAADLPYIFDRFYRADSSRSKDNTSSGYGLGLAIARTIADHHQGALTVTSVVGKGSTFTLTLPRQ